MVAVAVILREVAVGGSRLDLVEYAVVGVNVVAGVGGAIPLGRHLSGMSGKPAGAARYVGLLLGVYFFECVAIVAGMLVPVFSAALAVVWGMVLGLWLRGRASRGAALRTSLFVSIYSSLPAASFMVVPLMMVLADWPILSAEGGARLGIPQLIPWPANTVLGFYAGLAVGVLALKTLITVTETCLLQRRAFLISSPPGAPS